jgi:hypothetical protein
MRRDVADVSARQAIDTVLPLLPFMLLLLLAGAVQVR